MLAALIAYKQTHGDCNVPQGRIDNRELGRWCNTQRILYRQNSLAPNRIERLEQLGFVWALLEVAWEEMFAALTGYKQAHGDCNVPQHWKDNPKLGIWCGTQRKAYKNNEISPDRVARLEDLGFRFGVREPKKR